MLPTRRTLLAGLAALPFARAAAASQSDPLGALIARHVGARGGAAALDRVTRAAIELSITEKGQTFPVHYLASLDPLVRVDIVIDGKRLYSEGIDRHGVWIWPGEATAATPSAADGAANALLHGVEQNLVGLHRFAERGHRLHLMPDESIDGIVYAVIEATFSTGHVSYLYVDPAGNLITRRRDRRAYHPDADPPPNRLRPAISTSGRSRASFPPIATRTMTSTRERCFPPTR